MPDPIVGDSTAPLTPPVAPTLASPQSGSTIPVPASVSTTSDPSAVPGSNSQPDLSGLLATYDKRVRDLQSLSDRNGYERNQVITQLTELQNQYSAYHQQSQEALAASAATVQQQIERARQLEEENSRIKGEALRAQALLEKPHLAAYAQFIPASPNPEEVKAAIEKLDQIHQNELNRYTQATPTLPQQQQAYQIPQTGFGQAPANALGLNQYRPNLPGMPTFGSPSQIPGSSPAQLPGQMNLQGGVQDPTDTIRQLFADAKNSSDPNAMSHALEQAKLLQNAYANAALGRSS